MDIDPVEVVAFLALRLSGILEKSCAGKPVLVIQLARTVEFQCVDLQALLAAGLLWTSRFRIETLNGVDVIGVETQTIIRAVVEVDFQGSIRGRPDIAAKGALLGAGYGPVCLYNQQ